MLARKSLTRAGPPLLGMLLLPLLVFADDPQAGPTGLQRDVVFTDYSPLSQNIELVRRLMTPLSAARIRRAMARSEMPRVGHEVADSVALNRALNTLFRDPHPDPDKLAECRARIEEKLTAELRYVEDLLADRKSDDALKLLEKIDAHYGGLAAPRSIALAEQIEAPPPKQAGRAEGQ